MSNTSSPLQGTSTTATKHTVYRDRNNDCPHHAGLCSYTSREHDRCPYCHKLWAAIDRCREVSGHCEEREQHLARHVKESGKERAVAVRG